MLIYAPPNIRLFVPFIFRLDLKYRRQQQLPEIGIDYREFIQKFSCKRKGRNMLILTVEIMMLNVYTKRVLIINSCKFKSVFHDLLTF